MTADQIFSIANAVAAVAWLLLAVLPRQRWVTSLATGAVAPALFAIAYIAIIASQWGSRSGGFSTLAGVSALFSNPWLLLAGWLHYLAFDLLVGTWEVRDARERGIPHLVVVPCLALTFMFGPAGWLLYNGVRLWYRRG
jgi:Domain of unknown function (DUF4281)